MVRLTRIYTRTGDGGKTALGDGTRVSKTHPRIAAYGTVDELNAVLGIVARAAMPATDRALIRRIQNDLFDIGADLCVPRPSGERGGDRLRVTASQVRELEQAIDVRNSTLAPLSSFVLPGGSATAAWLHLARVVCRRAELGVVGLLENEADAVGAQVLPYLNRLSDLLFVMSRCANAGARGDVLWRPGAGQAEPERPAAPQSRPTRRQRRQRRK